MRKKYGILILVAVLVLQLLVPVGMIAYRRTLLANAEEKGTLYYFRLNSCEYYYDSDFVSFYVTDSISYSNSYGEGAYAVVTEKDGEAGLTVQKSKPKGDSYLRSSYKWFSFPASVYPLARSYRCGENQYWNLMYKDGRDDSQFFSPDNPDVEVFFAAKVYRGILLPQGILIDGQPVEKVLENFEKTLDSAVAS